MNAWLHEIAHMLGLGHVNDVTQIMNPSLIGLDAYQSGDREGLVDRGRRAGLRPDRSARCSSATP